MEYLTPSAVLTPLSILSICRVDFEQALGHIDASLQEVNVVQDIYQNVLLLPKQRQG